MNVRQAGAFTELIRKEERARRTWEETHGRQFGVQATTTSSSSSGALSKTKTVNDDLFASNYSATPQLNLYPAPVASPYAVPVPVAYVPVPVAALGGASTSRRATTGNLAAPLPQAPPSMSMYAPSTGSSTSRRSTAPAQGFVWPDTNAPAQPYPTAPLSPASTARYRLPLVANAPASNYSVAETTGHIAIPVPAHLSPVAGASNRKNLAMAVPLELSRYVPIDERDGNNGHFLAAGLGYGPSHRNHFKYRNDNREGRVDLALFRSNHMQ